MLKIKGTEIQQALTELMMQAAGPFAQAFRPVNGDDGLRSLHGVGLARATATCARPRSTPARTRSSATSSPRRRWACKRARRRRHGLRTQRRAAAPRRDAAQVPEHGYSFDARAKIMASPPATARTSWAALAEMGMLGVPFAAEHGGFGGTTVDMMVVMEAIGEALVVEPYLATVGLGGQFVARGGTAAQQKRILPALDPGQDEDGVRARPSAARRYDLAQVALQRAAAGDGWVLDGEKRVVLHGGAADLLVVSARTAGGDGDEQGISLFLVERDGARRRGEGVPHARQPARRPTSRSPASRSGATRCSAPKGRRLRARRGGRRLRDRARVRGGGRRDQVRARRHARVSEDAPAVRRADRHASRRCSTAWSTCSSATSRRRSMRVPRVREGRHGRARPSAGASSRRRRSRSPTPAAT